MSVIVRGLDCDFDVSTHVAALQQHGFGFVGQYLKPWFTLGAVQRLHAAGLKILTYQEGSATAALQGGGKGAADGAAALKRMTQLGAPPDAAVCMTVDTDVAAQQLPAVEDYFAAADGILWGHFRIMGYADGTAISGLRQHGLPLCVLAGAMGWDGSREFAKSGQPNVVQGPTIAAAAGASWPPAGLIPGVDPIEWPALGFDYDPLIALTPDYGAW